MTTVRDEAICQVITARLGADSRISGQTIEVHVDEDRVTLVGVCDSEKQRELAEMIARGICGVHEVVDKIRVRRLAQAI